MSLYLEYLYTKHIFTNTNIYTITVGNIIFFIKYIIYMNQIK